MVTTLEHNTRMRRTKDTRARTPLDKANNPHLSQQFPFLHIYIYLFLLFSRARCLLKRNDKVFRNIPKLKILRIVILKNQLPHKVARPLLRSLSLSLVLPAACRIATYISGVSNDKRMFTRVRTHPEWTGCRPEYYTDISRKSRESYWAIKWIYSSVRLDRPIYKWWARILKLPMMINDPVGKYLSELRSYLVNCGAREREGRT